MHNPFVPETLEGWSVLHMMYRIKWNDLRAVAEEGVRSPRSDGPEAVAEEFEALLRRTVGREMVVIDAWSNRIHSVDLTDARRADCGTCGRREFEFVHAQC